MLLAIFLLPIIVALAVPSSLNLADVHLQLATRGHAALSTRAGAPVVPFLASHIPKCTTTCATKADAYAINNLIKCSEGDTSCACRIYEMMTSKCVECMTTAAGQPQKAAQLFESCQLIPSPPTNTSCARTCTGQAQAAIQSAIDCAHSNNSCFCSAITQFPSLQCFDCVLAYSQADFDASDVLGACGAFNGNGSILAPPASIAPSLAAASAGVTSAGLRVTRWEAGVYAVAAAITAIMGLALAMI